MEFSHVVVVGDVHSDTDIDVLTTVNGFDLSQWNERATFIDQDQTFSSNLHFNHIQGKWHNQIPIALS